MDESTPSRRTDVLAFTPESTAVNIQKYLDVHRPGTASGAILVVAASLSGRVGQEEAASASSGFAKPSVRHAVDSLQHHRDSKTP